MNKLNEVKELLKQKKQYMKDDKELIDTEPYHAGYYDGLLAGIEDCIEILRRK